MRRIGALAVLCTLLTVTPALAAPLGVVFPPNGYHTTASHIFLVGTAPAGTPVTVDGKPVERSRTGNFAPTVPLAPGDNAIEVRAGTRTLMLHVVRATPAPPPTGLAFAPGSLLPAADVTRLPGERVRFEADAPADAQVSVLWNNRRVPLVREPVGMALPPNQAVLTGDNAPGPTALRFVGAMQLTGPTPPSRPIFELRWHGQLLRQPGPGRLAVLDSAQLPVVAIAADDTITRTGPSTDYSRGTPLPRGVESAVTGSTGDWLRLECGEWVARSATVPMPNALPPRTIVRSVSLNDVPGWTECRIPLERPVPFAIAERDHRFALTLYGATAQTDTIRENEDALVERLTFLQTAPDRLRYDFRLKTPFAWGYTARYDGSVLVLSLRHRPTLATGWFTPPLAGQRIVIDPGHGGPIDTGTTGPTGLHEKDVTLPMAFLVRDALVRRGAQVLLTRTDDRYVSLAERDADIRRAAPVLALSLHCNALPDDGDAEHTQGLGAFWYDPLSQPFAAFMARSLCARLDRPLYGLFWDNLALTRPHVCPAMLLELGFLTHPAEAEWLADPAAQRRYAEAIADAIVAYLRRAP